ncbi:MAG: MFS transporter [Pseudomonadota bacterium]
MRWRVLVVVGLLYTAQFIPFSFANMALPIILRREGFSATDIGLIQLASLPYIFKFLWAPLIDRFQLGRQRYKSWILALSIIHVLGICALAFTDPIGNAVPLFIALAVAGLAVSTQDVAVDAFVISTMRAEERTMGSTFQNVGLYAGAIVGGFGFLYLYDYIGWTAALLIQAGLFVLPLFTLFLVPEPERPAEAPKVDWTSAFRFFTQERMIGWLAVLAVMRLPLVLTLIPMRLMMVDQGMSLQEIAVWFGLIAMCAGGGAASIFGPLLRKLPQKNALLFVGLLNIPFLLAITTIAALFPSEIRYAIVIVWVAIAITDVVMFRAAMDRTRIEVPGFDFSAQIAVYLLIPGLLDPVVGYVIDTQGYLPTFFAAIPLALIPLAIVYGLFARLPKTTMKGEQSVNSIS